LLVLLIAYYFRFFVKRRFRRLQNILQYSNERLAKKEAQLHQKIRELEAQRTELNNVSSNIHTLELFTKEIPKKASWNDIITAMGKAVTQSSEVDAFEIAFMEEDEIVHRGYSRLERSGYTFRTKPFDVKTSLTCWALANEKEVLINDYDAQHTIYIDEKEAYRFQSLLFVPFVLESDQPVVLCAYSTQKNHYDHNDLVMFRILSQFIHFSIHEELTKKV
jgi:transcriptional regulator with GAF, ATPase, and Fis domain